MSQTIIQPKPLPRVLPDTDGYLWGEHVLDRMQERGIGIYEVLAAIVSPDYTKPSKYGDGSTICIRGDVKVAYLPHTRCIKSVMSLNGDLFTRKPIQPHEVQMLPMSTGHEEPTQFKSATHLPEWVDWWILVTPPGTGLTAQEWIKEYMSRLPYFEGDTERLMGQLVAILNTRAKQGRLVKPPKRGGKWTLPFPIDVRKLEQVPQQRHEEIVEVEEPTRNGPGKELELSQVQEAKILESAERKLTDTKEELKTKAMALLPLLTISNLPFSFGRDDTGKLILQVEWPE